MPIKGFRKVRDVCSVVGCGRFVKSASLCAGHYQRVKQGHELGGPFVRPTPIDRFMDSVLMCPMSGCWWWIKNRINTGYSQFRDDGPHLGHRWIWTHMHGSIPPGLCVLHSCDNGRAGCVAPNHLFIGTQRDNMRDMVAKGRNYNGHGRRP